ncbi:cation diffusion facilitator family transporter [Vibrio cholerae]|nr:cation diffusion facilitator family transporter [Vibrio cholerae]EGR1070492.1 cation diffusion facilitator family transporter [Vibrio cholerae]MCD1170631.1 cation transporter [Vibrio cholerae]MCD1188739.1 cation diffusion facilitator family transporter [Vibrio cholerae]MCD1196093.1 cation transporter [Vibrio cholerae]
MRFPYESPEYAAKPTRKLTMCSQSNFNEKRVLTLSALIASGFAGSGLLVGLLVGSMVIVFDGVYSLVSLLLTLLSLAVSRFIQKPSDARFPFGRAVLEPLVIAIKGLVILLIVSYSLYSSLTALLSGGREVDPSIATLFGVFSVTGCALAWWKMAGLSRRHPSGLIAAEVKQWQMDTLLSLVVMVGFIAAWLINLTPWAHYSVYADPMMMLLMSFYFIKLPLGMLKSALREILLMAPSHDIQQAVSHSVQATQEHAEQPLELYGVAKVGRELWVEVALKTAEDDSVEVEDIQRIENHLQQSLAALPYQLQLTVSVAR